MAVLCVLWFNTHKDIKSSFFHSSSYICDMLNSPASELPGSHGKLFFCIFCIFISSQTSFFKQVIDAFGAVVLCLCRKFTVAHHGRWRGKLFRAPEVSSAQYTGLCNASWLSKLCSFETHVILKVNRSLEMC